MSTDTRIPYGARCTWWDSIDKIGTVQSGVYKLPCCPHCGSMLFEVESQEVWDGLLEKYESSKPYPGYKAMMEWARGKCFPNFQALEAAYAESKRETPLQ